MLFNKVIVALTLAASAANVNAVPVRGFSPQKRQHEPRSDTSNSCSVASLARSASQSGGSWSGDGGDTVDGQGGSKGSQHGSGWNGHGSSGGHGHRSGDGGHESSGGGNESGNGGNESGNGGNESGNGGDESGNGGNESGSGGNESGNGGDESGGEGQESGGGGEETGGDSGENGNGLGSSGGSEGGGPEGGAISGQQPDGNGESDPVPTGGGLLNAAESGAVGQVVDGAEGVANGLTQAAEPAGTVRDAIGDVGFKDAIAESENNQLVVIDVYDPRCVHCGPVGELLKKLAKQYPNVKFYQVAYESLSEDYRSQVLGITNLPAVFFYKNGKQIVPPSPIVGDKEADIRAAVEENQ